jgi:hypothetical protein
MEWQTIIIYGLLIIFAFSVVARISGQTLIEFLHSLGDWISGKGEDVVDGVREV